MNRIIKTDFVRALSLLLLFVGICAAQQASAPALTHNVGDYFGSNQLRGAFGIIRVEGAGASFHVSEMYSVVMEPSHSSPTASLQAIELNLPAGAIVTSALAAGPSDQIQRITPQPVPQRIGYYSLPYRLTPGNTKFAVNYDLSPRDKITFRPTFPYPIEKLLIIFPNSMRLISHAIPLTQPSIRPQQQYQTSKAEHIPAGQAIEFEIAVIKPGSLSARMITLVAAAALAFILTCAYIGLKRRMTNAVA